MCVSLADQDAEHRRPGAVAHTLAIGLGANVPSPSGDPLDTLMAVRPRLEAGIRSWMPTLETSRVSSDSSAVLFFWSPLFSTEPVGGPPAQPPYLNAVLVVQPLSAQPLRVSVAEAHQLLDVLQGLERQFGRQRVEFWGPRSLDLDLLWIGTDRIVSNRLQLPHPLLLERSFVLAPLAQLHRQWRLVGIDPESRSVGELLAALEAGMGASSVDQLPRSAGWPL